MASDKQRIIRSSGQPVAFRPRAIIFEVAVAYYVTLATLVLVSLSARLPFEDNGSPTSWYWLMAGFYYVVPFLVAAVYGFLFRPFAAHFRNLLFVILAAHMVYSLAVYAFRLENVRALREDVATARSADVSAKSVEHHQYDQNGDGLVDQVLVFVELDLADLTDGEYRMSGQLSLGREVFSKGPIDPVNGVLAPGKTRHIKARFEFDPQQYAEYFGKGEWEFNVQIEKILRPDARGEAILAWGRWSPFLRFCSWSGTDLEFSGAVELIDVLPRVDVFEFMPLQLVR